MPVGRLVKPRVELPPDWHATKAYSRGSIGDLSARETEVLRLASRGLTDKEIAARVGLSLTTIRTYWERIRPKVKALNRAGAVAWYMTQVFEQRELVQESSGLSDLVISAMQQVVGAMLIVDRDGLVESANDSAEILLNMREAELIGKPVESILTSGNRSFYEAVHANPDSVNLPPPIVTPAVFAKARGTNRKPLKATVRAIKHKDVRHTVITLADAAEHIDARRRGAASADTLTLSDKLGEGATSATFGRSILRASDPGFAKGPEVDAS